MRSRHKSAGSSSGSSSGSSGGSSGESSAGSGGGTAPGAPVLVFAALGDATRIALMVKLSGGEQHSIAQLTEGTDLTRQAITKHLAVLESAGVVRAARHGRERLYKLDPEPINEAQEYLALVSSQWDRALQRLKAFVEE